MSTVLPPPRSSRALIKNLKRRVGGAILGAAAGWRAAGELDASFHELKAIFVHIPKAAGSSVSLALYGHQVGHGAIIDCYLADYAATREYFKFAFVREPLDRLVSAFHFLRAGGMNAADRQFAQRRLAGLDFEDFVRGLRHDRTLRRHMHFRPQHEFVSSPGRPRHLLVDFVGRFETMEQDFEHVCARLGRKTSLPVRNAGGSKPALPSLSASTCAAVREIYAIDYEVFGYD